MKTLLIIMTIGFYLFADESIYEKQMRWQQEEQTRIMQEQLRLQRQQLQEMQMQQNINQGRINRMNGGVDFSPLQNWLMQNQ